MTYDPRDYKPPFPYFGGKSRIASVVWDALGDVDNYVEPFCGSAAVLMLRPAWHNHRVETINDTDGMVANFWRAVKSAPDEVARWANNPVNEIDLTARHIWLVQHRGELLLRLHGDPDYYDAKIAGWWVWGLCCWIGGGWCFDGGSWTSEGGKLVKVENRTLPGVSRRIPYLGFAGQGVNRPSKTAVMGDGVDTGLQELTEYFRSIAERLRYVRVCCGDWTRVVTNGALNYGNTVGIFLDPPYPVSLRTSGLYPSDHHDNGVAANVGEWAIAHGNDPRLRIVLAGYEAEYDLPGWEKVQWIGRSGYSYTEKGVSNKHRERLWLSPSCLKVRSDSMPLPLLGDEEWEREGEQGRRRALP